MNDFQAGEWTYPAQPENIADYDWRWRVERYRLIEDEAAMTHVFGDRFLLQCHDDAIGQWVDIGVFRDRDAIRDRIGR